MTTSKQHVTVRPKNTNDIEDAGYDVNFYTIEVSSRGFITKENAQRLKNILKFTENSSAKQCRDLMQSLQKIVLVCSYCTFYSKYDNEWNDPPLVNF